LTYQLFDKKRWQVKISWLPALIITSLAVVFLSNMVVRQGYSTTELNLLSYEFDRPVYRCGKVFRLLNPAGDYCELTKPNSQANSRLLLIGDSHADSIKESFVKMAERGAVSVFFPIHSPPVLGKTKADRILQIAEEIGADAVVAHY